MNSVFTNNGPRGPQADTRNAAGGLAYSLDDEEALAQLAVTGCINNTFYADAESQLSKILELANKVSPEFLAKTAVYARERGSRKDTPAILLAVLSIRDTMRFRQAAPRVFTHGKIVRNFVQVIRSGKVGRKSLGTAPRNAIRDYVTRSHAMKLFRDAVGNQPTIQDVFKLAHIGKGSNPQKEATIQFLLGKEYDVDLLPPNVKGWLAFKADPDKAPVPDVDFRMLTSLPLTEEHWKKIALQSSWQSIRQNLNTFERHGVFKDDKIVKALAAKLADKDEILKSRVMPYQLLTTYLFTTTAPMPIRNALQQAMEIATQNVPVFEGLDLVIGTDVSGSMHTAVTGARKGATSKTTCVQVASLVTSALWRRNPNATVIPFTDRIHDVSGLNPMDTVMTNASKLAAYPAGGTNVSLVLEKINRDKIKADIVVVVSDNESWLDRPHRGRSGFQAAWQTLKKRNPKAKLVLVDLAPNTYSPAKPDKDVLQVGGFSDQVWDVVASFAKGETHGLVDAINRTDLDLPTLKTAD